MRETQPKVPTELFFVLLLIVCVIVALIAFWRLALTLS